MGLFFRPALEPPLLSPAGAFTGTREAPPRRARPAPRALSADWAEALCAVVPSSPPGAEVELTRPTATELKASELYREWLERGGK